MADQIIHHVDETDRSDSSVAVLVFTLIAILAVAIFAFFAFNGTLFNRNAAGVAPAAPATQNNTVNVPTPSVDVNTTPAPTGQGTTNAPTY
jgi:predicted permease